MKREQWIFFTLTGFSEGFDTIFRYILREVGDVQTGWVDCEMNWKQVEQPGLEGGDQWHKILLEAGN